PNMKIRCTDRCIFHANLKWVLLFLQSMTSTCLARIWVLLPSPKANNFGDLISVWAEAWASSTVEKTAIRGWRRRLVLSRRKKLRNLPVLRWAYSAIMVIAKTVTGHALNIRWMTTVSSGL